MNLKHLRDLTNQSGSLFVMNVLTVIAGAALFWQLWGITTVLIYLILMMAVTNASLQYHLKVFAQEIIQLHEKIEDLEKRNP